MIGFVVGAERFDSIVVGGGVGSKVGSEVGDFVGEFGTCAEVKGGVLDATHGPFPPLHSIPGQQGLPCPIQL